MRIMSIIFGNFGDRRIEEYSPRRFEDIHEVAEFCRLNEQNRASNIDRLYTRNYIFDLSRGLINNYSSGSVFCAFGSMGVWQSSVDFFTMEKLWSQCEPPYAAANPCIVFRHRNQEAAASYFSIMFYSGCDGFMALGEDDWIYYSHDEYLQWRFSDHLVSERLKNTLSSS